MSEFRSRSLLALLAALGLCAPHVSSAAGPPADASAPESAASRARLGVLAAYHWRLDDARDARGARIDRLLDHGRKPLQLDFTDATDGQGDADPVSEGIAGWLLFSNLCNNQGGAFHLVGETIEVDYGPTTMLSCGERANGLARELGKRRSARLVLSIATRPPRLVLKTAGGDLLTFDGVPTPATRYGDPGERLLLEVSHQRLSCTHPAVPGGRCLQVREATHDSHGSLLPNDLVWTPLFQEIEGFHHEEGIRYTIDAKRYKLPRPTEAGLSHVYIWRHTPASGRVDMPGERPPGEHKPGTVIVTPKK